MSDYGCSQLRIVLMQNQKHIILNAGHIFANFEANLNVFPLLFVSKCAKLKVHNHVLIPFQFPVKSVEDTLGCHGGSLNRFLPQMEVNSKNVGAWPRHARVRMCFPWAPCDPLTILPVQQLSRISGIKTCLRSASSPTHHSRPPGASLDT